MKQYTIEIKKKAAKYIQKQNKSQQRLLLTAIEKLPSEGDIARVEGRKGYYRLRVGDYRVIFTVDNGRLVVVVIDANSRGQIYKRY